MGAFKTSYGLESICSIAVPIPILNETIWDNIIKTDNDVSLRVLNVVGRFDVGEISYGDVWDDNFFFFFNPLKCKDCELECQIEEKCPTRAVSKEMGIDRTRCFNCGTCAVICPKGAFKLDLKSVNVKLKNMKNKREIPVVLRQSDRYGAIKLANQLKGMILNREFIIKEPTGRLEFAPKVY